jgi:transcriptional regulator with XRE-family HTH domain
VADVICPLCNGTGHVEGTMHARLALARKAKEMTQEEACQSLGITRSQLANIEGGRSTPQPDFLIRAAKLYRVSADYILGIDHG